MKLRKSHICNQCATRIDNYGFICLELVEQVCQDALHLDISYYHENDSPSHIKTIFRFLELQGMVISSEAGEAIVIIRPNLANGIYDIENEQFCWCAITSKL